MIHRNDPDDDRPGTPVDPHDLPFHFTHEPRDESRSDGGTDFGAGLRAAGAADATTGAASTGSASGGERRRGRRKRGRGRGRGRGERAQAPSSGAGDAGAGGDEPWSEGASSDDPSSGRRMRSGRRGPPIEGDDERAGDSASSGGDAPSGGDGGEGGGRKKRRRRRRRKGGARALEGTLTGEAGGSDAGADEDDAGERDAGADRDDGDRASAPEGARAEGGGRRKRRRRRGGRGRRREGDAEAGEPVRVEHIPGEEDDLPLPAEEETERGDEEAAEPREGGRKRRKKKRRASRRKRGALAEGAEGEEAEGGEDEEDAREEVERDQLILVNAIDFEEKRVAVLENGRIVDLLMTVESQDSLVSDIYRGKVVNLEPAIGAAFVDFGQGRNGFLHTSDVLSVYGEEGFTLDRLLTMSLDPEEWDENSSQPNVGAELDEAEEPAAGSARKRDGGDRPRRGRKRLPITDLLKNGDYVVVQVTKDAIGDKGPTLTTYISIPGRYLVLMPSMERTGVSRKIEDEKERRRLKRILQSMKIPPGMGVIVRTAGIGKSKAELRRDLDYLLGVWDAFGKRLKTGRGPMPLYQESDVAIRTLRDLFSSRTEAVIVDDPMVHEKLVDFARQVMPEHVDRIRMHDAERPLFHYYGIEQDFERVFARRVELPSGGSIVFDQTEALVAIDVNSGRTRSDGFDFEDIALKTNLDAVPEIARQIRLRDLGGIIVCDFIDMMRSSNIRHVERAFRAELANDRARSKVGRISQFGLLEMTRQRLGPGTHKKVFQSCPRCRGTGRIRTVQSRAASILRRLGSALTQKGFSTVDVRAHPEVVEYLGEDLRDYIRALEHRFEKEIHLTAVPDQPEDSVLRYLRADGREVRPGGRRKR